MKKNEDLIKDKKNEGNNATQPDESQRAANGRESDNKKDDSLTQEEIETELKIHQAQTERD